MSWTLNREQGLAYARGEVVIGVGPAGPVTIHHVAGSWIASATVPREWVIAYIEREREVIVPSFRGYPRRVVPVWATNGPRSRPAPVGPAR